MHMLLSIYSTYTATLDPAIFDLGRVTCQRVCYPDLSCRYCIVTCITYLNILYLWVTTD